MSMILIIFILFFGNIPIRVKAGGSASKYVPSLPLPFGSASSYCACMDNAPQRCSTHLVYYCKVTVGICMERLDGRLSGVPRVSCGDFHVRQCANALLKPCEWNDAWQRCVPRHISAPEQSRHAPPPPTKRDKSSAYSSRENKSSGEGHVPSRPAPKPEGPTYGYAPPSYRPNYGSGNPDPAPRPYPETSGGWNQWQNPQKPPKISKPEKPAKPMTSKNVKDPKKPKKGDDVIFM